MPVAGEVWPTTPVTEITARTSFNVPVMYTSSGGKAHTLSGVAAVTGDTVVQYRDVVVWDGPTTTSGTLLSSALKNRSRSQAPDIDGDTILSRLDRG